MNQTARRPTGYPLAYVVVSVGLFLFAMGEAHLRTRYDVGLRVSDFARAGWGALMFSGLALGLSWGIDRIAIRLPKRAWTLALAVVTSAPCFAAFYLSLKGPSKLFEFWPTGVGLLAAAFFFVRGNVHRIPQVGIVGPLILLGACSALGLPAQYAHERWDLNGYPIAIMVAALIPATVALTHFVTRELDESPVLRMVSPYLVGALAIGGLAAFPHVFPGLLFYLKLVGASFLVAGSIAFFSSRKGHQHSAGPKRATDFRLVAIVGALSVIALIWSRVQPVQQRFGALGFDSVAGLGAAVVSLPEDRDGDGYYAVGVPILDCDDGDAAVHPGVTTRSCEPVSPEKRERDPTGVKPPRHVVIVFSDGLRASDVYDPEVMPLLADRRAGRVSFERAYSPGNTTRLSVRPMLTGLTPTFFVHEPKVELPDGAWWFERVQSSMAVRWIVASEFAWMHDPQAWMNDPLVETYIGGADRNGRNIGLAMQEAIEHINRHPEGAAVGLFSTDPHIDYRCEDGTRNERRCYLEELAALDEALEALFDALGSGGLIDETLVVLTSDHGEEQGEHGNFGQHASTLFEEQIHVPLVFWYPELPETTVSTPVSTLSLEATLDDIWGFEPRATSAETSLLSVIVDGREVEPALVHHWTGLVLGVGVRRSAVIEEDLKLEYDFRTGHVRLVDLSNDPDEVRNVAGESSNATEVERLLDLLQARHADSFSRAVRIQD